MSWIGVITDAGAAILAQWDGGGHTLTLDGATVGSGITPEANLRAMVDLKTPEDTAQIVQVKEVTGGTQIKVQVLAAADAYTAHEVGIWAHIDSGTSTLIAVHQDSGDGVSVPDEDTSPDFAFALYCVHEINNAGDISVTIDPTVLVTQATVGALTDLTTTDKDSIVDAINEVKGRVDTSVQYVAQYLTNTQKEQARGNIAAAPTSDISNLYLKLAPSYSEYYPYDLGAYCTYQKHLYRCTTAITTPEEWNSAHWTLVSVGAELVRLQQLIDEIGFHDMIEVTLPNISALPMTFDVAGITVDHGLIQEGFAAVRPSSGMGANWTLTPGNGTITVSGTFSGSTPVTIVASMGIKRTVTGSASA